MSISADPGTALQLLVDRAQISDLMLTFARALDDLDGDAYAATYVEDGVFEGVGFRMQGREQLTAGVGLALGRYAARWHLTANHAISVDGDEATLCAYALGVHILSAEDLGRHADRGGRYDCALRRVDGAWRFVNVRVSESWVAGAPDLPH